MSKNIFDMETEFSQDPLPQEPVQNRSGFMSFLAGTATLAFLAVVAPIYIHVLVKIAIWSWNLI